MVVKIPKGGGTNFRGIGLVEVPRKAISGIINIWTLSSIQFYDALHVFCAGRGTRTSTLKENLIQQLIAMRETSLHYILLELRKAYHDLETDRFIDILAGYGVGPKRLRILRIYWVQIQMAAKEGGGGITNSYSRATVG